MAAMADGTRLRAERLQIMLDAEELSLLTISALKGACLAGRRQCANCSSGD